MTKNSSPANEDVQVQQQPIEHPSPTNEEVLAAQQPKTRRNEVDHPPADPPPAVEWSKRPHKRERERFRKDDAVSYPPTVERRTSEPESPSTNHDASYKTRDSKPKGK